MNKPQNLAKPVDDEKSKDFQQFTSKTLPSAKDLNLNQEQWLNIYWNKIGLERGKKLTDSEKAWNIPKISDPWGGVTKHGVVIWINLILIYLWYRRWLI
jgi:hypothetical protein